MARKGQFKKGGGRVGHASHHGKHKAKTRYVTKTKTRTVHVKAKHHRRRSHGGGGVGLKHLAIAGGALAFLTGAASPIAAIKDNANKLPGAKTFGATAVAGVALLAIDKFVKPNKWLRAAGYAGIVIAAATVGNKGSSFSFVGDAPQLRGADDGSFDGDVEGVDVDDDDSVQGDDYDGGDQD